MVSASYLRVYYNGNYGGQTGRKIYLNVEPLERQKGIETTDFPIPSLNSSSRVLIPTSGNIDNFTLNCVLNEETSKVAANISSSNVETDRTDVRTIAEQWDFIYEEVMEIPSTEDSGIFAKYELYDSWSGNTYEGWCTVAGAIDNEQFTGQVGIRLLFKVGKNPLASIT